MLTKWQDHSWIHQLSCWLNACWPKWQGHRHFNLTLCWLNACWPKWQDHNWVHQTLYKPNACQPNDRVTATSTEHCVANACKPNYTVTATSTEHCIAKCLSTKWQWHIFVNLTLYQPNAFRPNDMVKSLKAKHSSIGQMSVDQMTRSYLSKLNIVSTKCLSTKWQGHIFVNWALYRPKACWPNDMVINLYTELKCPSTKWQGHIFVVV